VDDLGVFLDGPVSNVKSLLRPFAERLFVKLGTAIFFALMVAIATGATLGLGLRYVAATCFVISIWLFGVALVQKRSFGRFSEWGEGLVFVLLAGGADFIAGLTS
jgi:hypothetical protein